MARQIISTPDAPQPKAPIAQAVRSGHLVFVSGITPFDLDLKLMPSAPQERCLIISTVI